MKKSTKLILAGISAGLVAFLVVTFLSGNKKNPNEMDLQPVVQAINIKCPMNVDNITRLDSAANFTNFMLTYYYSVLTVSYKEVDLTQFQESMKSRMQNKYEKDAEFETFRKAKVALAFEYKDKNGKFLAYFVCDNLKNKL